MSTLNVGVDPGTIRLVERIARRTGRTKSEVVRDALEALRDEDNKPEPRPSEAMAHIIGSWDSGGLRFSERTGEHFAKLLQAQNQAHDTHRHPTAGRADRSH